VRGSDRLRAWRDGFSLHAGVVIPDHDRDAPELCAATAPGPRSRTIGGPGPLTAASRSSSSGRGPTAALTWCSNRSRSSAGLSASSHRRGVTWHGTRGCSGLPANHARSSARRWEACP
jgi:hypothetical protein